MPARNPRRMGKSEARSQFLPLVQALVQGAGPVEITDRGKVAAVLMSNADYQLLLAHSKQKPGPMPALVGSMLLEGDLAEPAITDLFDKSLGRRAEEA